MDSYTNSFQNSFKKKNIGEISLAILFIIYLIMGYKTPTVLANVIDTTYGKVGVVGDKYSVRLVAIKNDLRILFYFSLKLKVVFCYKMHKCDQSKY